MKYSKRNEMTVKIENVNMKSKMAICLFSNQWRPVNEKNNQWRRETNTSDMCQKLYLKCLVTICREI
jgi:hypothetical protein